MKREEEFKNWLQRSLQEETKDIYFTAQAKEEVRLRILERQKQSGKNTIRCSPAEEKSAELLQEDGYSFASRGSILRGTKQMGTPQTRRRQPKNGGLLGWWQQEFTLSLKAVAIYLVILILFGAFYTRTFFYVSPRQIAKFEQREQIILHDERVPFGARQHLVASLDRVKGVDRP
ncbi:MAG TPA: hypothetical protein GXX46_09805 [Peptococcaceae bacterium]|nr:hypothetical protein [Peptococcaceae bacterium]